MPIFSASLIRSSRNWGCAMEMILSARSQVFRPLRLIMPYSVTRYCTVERGSVQMEPGVRGGHDAGLQLAILALHGGGQADEGFTALGQIGAHDEVQLAAGAEICLMPADSAFT